MATLDQPQISRSRGRFAGQWVDGFVMLIRIVAVVIITWGLVQFIVQSTSGTGGLTGPAFRDLLVAGLAQGAMYGLLALGYSMVYGVLGFINFAHGEVFMAGTVISFFIANALFNAGWWEEAFLLSLLIVLLSSMIISTLAAVIIERVAYRPLRNAPRLIPLITSIGVSFFLQNAFFGLFGPAVKSYPRPPEWLTSRRTILGFEIEGTKLLVIVIAIVASIGLYLFITRTKTGKAMRAVAEDKEIAALMGINVDRTIVTTFAVGGAMAGVAGLSWAILFRGVSFITGFIPGIKAFTAAVVGGIGNLAGAMGGGVFLGLAESVAPLVILEPLGVTGVSQLKDAVAFAVLVLVLIFRPTGLFGERLSARDRV